MGKPAARIGDTHNCPMVTPGSPPVPHTGGAITGLGCLTVLIEGQPAATLGDPCICVGAMDSIISGSSGVFIEGKPAARQGDRCAHGGVVIGGCESVEIGELMGRVFYKEGDEEDKKEDFIEPSGEEKIKIINQAIQDCIALLERKLKLLEKDDPKTLAAFKKWFGMDDEEAREVILQRIRRALRVSRTLSVGNFKDRSVEQKEEGLFAEVYHLDKSYTIYVNHLFWQAKSKGKDSKAGIIVHELSHFEDIGNTQDYVYKNYCLRLAKFCPKDAINNADSFEYFVVC